MKTFKVVTLVVLLASSVLLVGTLGAAAGSNSVSGGDAPDESATATDEITEVGRQDIAIRDLVVTVSDTHVRGTDLPSESIDEATYTVEDSVITTNGFLVTYQDETYRICPITITVDDVGLVLENVSMGEEKPDDGTATDGASSDHGGSTDGTDTETDRATEDRCPHVNDSCDCCG